MTLISYRYTDNEQYIQQISFLYTLFALIQNSCFIDINFQVSFKGAW